MTSVRRITISVASLEKALELYSDALGLTVLWSSDEVARLDATGVEVMLHRRTPTPGDFGVAATFQVDDVDSAAQRCLDAGAALLHGPDDEPWGERQAVLRDADGHVVCLVTPHAAHTG